MRCNACNTDNDKSTKFCKNCGKRLVDSFYDRDLVETDDIDTYEEFEFVSFPSDDENEDIFCPKCGSSNIHFVTKEEGSDFDGVNACCGFLVFGPLGLLCGLISNKKTKTTRKCMKCDNEF